MGAIFFFRLMDEQVRSNLITHNSIERKNLLIEFSQLNRAKFENMIIKYNQCRSIGLALRNYNDKLNFYPL